MLLTKSKTRRTVSYGEVEKSCIADHIWKENGNHLPLWDEVKIIDRKEENKAILRSSAYAGLQ